ncbi:hypothetical protein M2306_001099 [Myroides gitamensis]|uniref:hypothetical protein n=1 Tax=Myroides odoratus TaxID=256 RepID=UPI0021673DC7|nr:hypothetical protein [Myroides odoratus]MCS4238661.1 hypothetical protein [Myroides odoratus]MDH6600405.1 hypothetical protein [Myroides gitamensis]
MKKQGYILLFLLLSNLLLAQPKTGINTTNPQATLEVNGDLIVRDLPVVKEKEAFYAIGHDQNNKIVSLSKDITSYSTYLGFAPMAPTHREELPFTLENGYITTLEGFGIGACYGVMIKFTIYFIGTTYIGAELHGISTSRETKYDVVTLTSTASIFGTSLETLAKATGCTATSGHTLSYNAQTKKISVSFADSPTYYPNAGLFVINKIMKVKQTN